MTLWIAYAKTGRELAVQDACEALGIEAHVPKRVDLIRQGKRRRPDAITSPYLPNYVFIYATDQERHWLRDVREIRDFMGVLPQEERAVRSFVDRVEHDYAARMAQIEAGQRVDEYNPGDLFTIMAGPFAGRTAMFRRMVEAGGLFPKIEATLDLELLGRPVIATVDPIDAKRASA